MPREVEEVGEEEEVGSEEATQTEGVALHAAHLSEDHLLDLSEALQAG